MSINRVSIGKAQLYVEKTFVKNDSFLDSVRSSFSGGLKEDIQVSPIEGQLLSVIVSMLGAHKILEVGTFVGYSALCMSQSLPKDGFIVTIEKDDYCAEIALKNFENSGKNIYLIKGDALDIIPRLEKYSPFDMMFIDAQKSSYLDYLLLAEKFLRKGAVVVADNTLLFNKIYDDSFLKQQSFRAMRKFNEYLANSDMYNSTLISTSEGITVAVKIT